jgi:hypothetical protein
MRPETVESFAIVVIQLQARLDAQGQIRVRDEIASESNRIGVAFSTIVSAVSGSNPPAAIIFPLNILRSCSDATGAGG